MAGRLVKIQRFDILGDIAGKAFAHRELGHVNRFGVEATGCKQLQHAFPAQVNRADFATYRVGDRFDHLVQFGLGMAARRHDRPQAGQDVAGGLGTCGICCGHDVRLAERLRECDIEKRPGGKTDFGYLFSSSGVADSRSI